MYNAQREKKAQFSNHHGLMRQLTRLRPGGARRMGADLFGAFPRKGSYRTICPLSAGTILMGLGH
jgi:hypothetical protein